MYYVIKLEVTGKVGRCEYDHHVVTLQHFKDFSSAVYNLKKIRISFRRHKEDVKIFGSDSDFQVIICTNDNDCTFRYWMEESALNT